MSEEHYETIESQLMMVIAEFESKWSEVWDAWIKTTDMSSDEAADMMICSYVYDEHTGNMFREFIDWYKIYDKLKAQIEEKHSVKIVVSCEGEVSATHSLQGGDTITV